MLISVRGVTCADWLCHQATVYHGFYGGRLPRGRGEASHCASLRDVCHNPVDR